MSLDVSLCSVPQCPNCKHPLGERRCVYDANITHNLGPMANAAGIYTALWRPGELLDADAAQAIRNAEAELRWADAREIERQLPQAHASDLIEPLRAGLAKLKANRAHYETFNAPNGWGLYEHLVPWVERYLEACEANPTAEVEVSR